MKPRIRKFVLILVLVSTLLATLACQLLAVPSSRSAGLAITNTPEQLVPSDLPLDSTVTQPEPAVIPGATNTPWPTDPPTWTPTVTPIPTETSTPTIAVTSTPTQPPYTWQSLPDLPRQINALAANPTNPKVIYAGTGANGSGSGVYKSEDSGLTWALVSTGLPDDDVVALAVSQVEPITIYAVTGHAGTVYASTDGAVTWKRLGSPEINGFGYQLVIDPKNGKTNLCHRSRVRSRSQPGWRSCMDAPYQGSADLRIPGDPHPHDRD